MTMNDCVAHQSLSVIIPCFNEEAVIEGCLESVKFADEIIVVDSLALIGRWKLRAATRNASFSMNTSTAPRKKTGPFPKPSTRGC